MRLLKDLALLVAIAILIALLLAISTTKVGAACQQTGRHPDWNPTGWQGCAPYGVGMASRWSGPGVAVNSCLWPWDACSPLRIHSLSTGRTITVTPTMFCDCWHGRASQKLVDLDPAAVRALGLDWGTGVYPVRVEPAASIPDTAMR